MLAGAALAALALGAGPVLAPPPGGLSPAGSLTPGRIAGSSLTPGGRA